MMDDSKRQLLAELIQKKLDGVLPDEQFLEMSAMLAASSQARTYYARTMATIAVFRQYSRLEIYPEIPKQASLGDSLNPDFWEAMGEYERTVELANILRPAPKPEAAPATADHVDPPERSYRGSRLSLYVAISGVAACLMMVLFMLLNPPTSSSHLAEPFVMLTDSLEARWQTRPLQIGNRLGGFQEPMKLLSGYAKFRFDSGAEVILEGPAEFQITTAEQMWVAQGKLVAIIPPTATGFRVDTPAMSVIDLGTEFSIEMDPYGVGTVHLFEGKASVLAGKMDGRRSYTLAGGQALRIDARLNRVESIPLQERGFVRRFDSGSGFIWRGKPETEASLLSVPEGFEFRLSEPGQTVILSVADDAQAGYRWYRSDDAVISPASDAAAYGPHISGETTHTLTISNVQRFDEGFYYCVVSTATENSISDVTFLLTKRLVSHWTFDTNLNDSPGGFKGDSVAAPRYIGGVPGHGASGTAIAVNSLYEAVEIPYTPFHNLETFTITGWMKVAPGSSGWRAFFSNRDIVGGVPHGVSIYVTPDDTLQFWTGHAAQWNKVGRTNLAKKGLMDTWVFVTAVYDGSSHTQKLYVNGVVDAELECSDTPHLVNRNRLLLIGAGDNNSYPNIGFEFAGAVDDVRYYSYVLSDDEILQLYAEGAGASSKK